MSLNSTIFCSLNYNPQVSDSSSYFAALTFRLCLILYFQPLVDITTWMFLSPQVQHVQN